MDVLPFARAQRHVAKIAFGRLPARRKRLPKQLQPDAIRTAYFAALRNILGIAHQLVIRDIVPMLPNIVSQSARERGDAMRFDASKDTVKRLIHQVTNTFSRQFPDERLEEIAREFGDRTSDFQRAQLNKQIHAAIGVEVPISDRRLGPLIQDFTKTNVELIQSIPEQYFEQLQERMLDGMADGIRPESLASELEERYGVAESRAQLIARDQIGKFYGDLNEERQTELGIEGYIWRGALDQRERSEHTEREGKFFSWDNPPEDGHPGEPIQCRCWAEPDFSSLLEAL